MRINNARSEAKALGKMLQKIPGNCGREEWDRMQYLRTFILTYTWKYKQASGQLNGESI
jgi:hypothetical protein